jgi:hypothetical protein
MVTRGDFSLFSFSISKPPKELASHSVGETPSAVHTVANEVEVDDLISQLMRGKHSIYTPSI